MSVFLPPLFPSGMLTGWTQALRTPRRASHPGPPPGSLTVPWSFHNSVSLCLLCPSPLSPSFSVFLGFLGGSAVKGPPASEETQESQVRFLGGEDPLSEKWQTCLENSMDRGAWQATALGVANNWFQLSMRALSLLIDFYFLESHTLWSFPPSTGRYMCLKTFCLPLM